ncbi:hypothetical protein FB451DRAFT_1423835 [Mycena latifolia]|nr:hypothetical protein FB451DRAFT_1423835 [Mycena latifolia]
MEDENNAIWRSNRGRSAGEPRAAPFEPLVPVVHPTPAPPPWGRPRGRPPRNGGRGRPRGGGRAAGPAAAREPSSGLGEVLDEEASVAPATAPPAPESTEGGRQPRRQQAAALDNVVSPVVAPSTQGVGVGAVAAAEQALAGASTQGMGAVAGPAAGEQQVHAPERAPAGRRRPSAQSAAGRARAQQEEAALQRMTERGPELPFVAFTQRDHDHLQQQARLWVGEFQPPPDYTPHHESRRAVSTAPPTNLALQVAAPPVTAPPANLALPAAAPPTTTLRGDPCAVFLGVSIGDFEMTKSYLVDRLRIDHWEDDTSYRVCAPELLRAILRQGNRTPGSRALAWCRDTGTELSVTVGLATSRRPVPAECGWVDVIADSHWQILEDVHALLTTEPPYDHQTGIEPAEPSWVLDELKDLYGLEEDGVPPVKIYVLYVLMDSLPVGEPPDMDFPDGPPVPLTWGHPSTRQRCRGLRLPSLCGTVALVLAPPRPPQEQPLNAAGPRPTQGLASVRRPPPVNVPVAPPPANISFTDTDVYAYLDQKFPPADERAWIEELQRGGYGGAYSAAFLGRRLHYLARELNIRFPARGIAGETTTAEGMVVTLTHIVNWLGLRVPGFPASSFPNIRTKEAQGRMVYEKLKVKRETLKQANRPLNDVDAENLKILKFLYSERLLTVAELKARGSKGERAAALPRKWLEEVYFQYFPRRDPA